MTKKYKRMIIDGASILMSLTGGVLYIANDLVAMPMVPKGWSDKWAAVVILSGVLHKAGQSIISYLEPEKPNARTNSHSNVHPESDAKPAADSVTQPNSDAKPEPNSLTVSASSASTPESS